MQLMSLHFWDLVPFLFSHVCHAYYYKFTIFRIFYILTIYQTVILLFICRSTENILSLSDDRCKEDKGAKKVPVYLRWPHMQADQVRGLSLREIGGGFTRHHRAPSIPAACNAIARPSTLVQKMQIIKKSRGHQNAVYCGVYNLLVFFFFFSSPSLPWNIMI